MVAGINSELNLTAIYIVTGAQMEGATLFYEKENEEL
jgi:hypothetical protein